MIAQHTAVCSLGFRSQKERTEMKVTYEKPTLSQVGKAEDVILGIASRGCDLDGHITIDDGCPSDIVDLLEPDSDSSSC
jgi:hypothetical protein